MLVNTIALQEARTSTEIENIFTTEDELYRAISDKNRDKNDLFELIRRKVLVLFSSLVNFKGLNARFCFICALCKRVSTFNSDSLSIGINKPQA